MNTAIIVAGGSGNRMNTKTRKQYLDLCGKKILEWTLDAFTGSDHIDRVCLVVPSEDVEHCKQSILESSSGYKNVFITTGGRERQESVYNGLCFFDDLKEDDIVVIHDGVRPFVSGEEIYNVIEGAKKYHAAIIAVPIVDTIKKSNNNAFIVETVERKNSWLALTPQAFKFSLIYEAHKVASENNIQGTDDASLVELTGGKVKLIEGNRTNIKITTPEDMSISEVLLKKNMDTFSK